MIVVHVMMTSADCKSSNAIEAVVELSLVSCVSHLVQRFNVQRLRG
jgi:hypothetical protein